ncbi:MAG: GH25 family lysozyme [Bacteroides caccae]|nr:GH25 family lysozyme [Clostridium perfringens]MDU3629465.1 GH25 family lysozyme [Bacteroides caccae]
MRGIDVSENNGVVDWGAVKANGFDFAIIRIGYGRGNLDSEFYNNVNGAINAGLAIGIYHYSYAMNEENAADEAEFVLNTLNDAGLTADKLPMGVWFDMEDADDYKANRGTPTSQQLTNICSVFINKLWQAGYVNTGLYASYDWLVNVLDISQLGGCAIWCAQLNNQCDYEGANLWQYTFSENIEGKEFDADLVLNWPI